MSKRSNQNVRAILTGGMTLRDLYQDDAEVRQAIRDYWHFYGKGMGATRHHELKSKGQWRLEFKAFKDCQFQTLMDVLDKCEVVSFESYPKA